MGSQLIEILCTFYWLADSGDYWHGTFLENLTADINMQSTACDLSLLYKHVRSTLHGSVATQVDVTIRNGDQQFENQTCITSENVDAKPRISNFCLRQNKYQH